MANSVATYEAIFNGYAETPLTTYVYSDNDARRVTGETNPEGTYTYTYDDAGELTGVTENSTPVGTYSYDSNGNRTGTGYTTGTDNEQTKRHAAHAAALSRA